MSENYKIIELFVQLQDNSMGISRIRDREQTVTRCDVEQGMKGVLDDDVKGSNHYTHDMCVLTLALV